MNKLYHGNPWNQNDNNIDRIQIISTNIVSLYFKYIMMKSSLHLSSLEQSSSSVVTPTADIDSSYIYSDKEIDKVKTIPDGSIKESTVSGFIPDCDCLDELFRILSSAGKLKVESCLTSRESGQELSMDLKIAGFIDVMAIKDPSSGERMVVCSKPSYDLGVKEAITLSAGGNDEELIDEDDLLNNEAPRGDVNSCGVDNSQSGVPGKKRACKNCSCGLAEEEADEASKAGKEVKVKTIDEQIAKSSSCGGCSRGDAFRCAGCPFLGKPAFEPGQEKVVLSMTDDFE